MAHRPAQVVDNWDTYAVRKPRVEQQQLVDFSVDLWEDARLDEVESWLEEHLRMRDKQPCPFHA